jgi:hypothetical protein
MKRFLCTSTIFLALLAGIGLIGWILCAVDVPERVWWAPSHNLHRTWPVLMWLVANVGLPGVIVGSLCQLGLWDAASAICEKGGEKMKCIGGGGFGSCRDQRDDDLCAACESTWRVGSKVRLNVYEGNKPMFQCHTPEDAARVVDMLNIGASIKRIKP